MNHPVSMSKNRFGHHVHRDLASHETLHELLRFFSAFRSRLLRESVGRESMGGL
jgi:hypothetical protein